MRCCSSTGSSRPRTYLRPLSGVRVLRMTRPSTSGHAARHEARTLLPPPPQTTPDTALSKRVQPRYHRWCRGAAVVEESLFGRPIPAFPSQVLVRQQEEILPEIRPRNGGPAIASLCPDVPLALAAFSPILATHPVTPISPPNPFRHAGIPVSHPRPIASRPLPTPRRIIVAAQQSLTWWMTREAAVVCMEGSVHHDGR